MSSDLVLMPGESFFGWESLLWVAQGSRVEISPFKFLPALSMLCPANPGLLSIPPHFPHCAVAFLPVPFLILLLFKEPILQCFGGVLHVSPEMGNLPTFHVLLDFQLPSAKAGSQG